MKMESAPAYRAMFHSDCPKNRFNSGIMRPTDERREREDGTRMRRYECLHCGEFGWYGVQPKTYLIQVEADAIDAARAESGRA